MDPEKLKRLEEFRAAKINLVPYGEETRDRFIYGDVQRVGPVEDVPISLGNGKLAFAEEQKFISPFGDIAGEHGRSIAAGRITQVNPGFAMDNPLQMELDPQRFMSEDGLGFDFQGQGEFTPDSDLPPEERLRDLDFLEALEGRPGADVSEDYPDFLPESPPLEPYAAEYLLYAPEVKKKGVSWKDIDSAKENRAAIEAELKLKKGEEEEAGMARLRDLGLVP